MKPKIRVDPHFLLIVSMSVLLVPIKWVLGAFLAALLHECCHLLAIMCLEGCVTQIRIGVDGAVIKTAPMSRVRELLCTIAGPLGSFLLLFLARWMPEMAICALVQGLFNMLPIYPLDGGRILFCLIDMLSPERAKKICQWIEGITMGLLVIAGIYWGIWLFLFALVIATKACLRKIPCKEGKLAVQ